MKLYVMRHGQTDWNVLGKIQGATDIELNEIGLEQAQNAKQELNQYDIDMIFCSPLKRTRKTAEIINEDKKIQIIYEDRLIERYFGELEGSKPIEDEIFQRYNFWDYEADIKICQVESVKEICQRVWGFLEEIKEKYSDKNILFVTHGGTAKTINSYFEGIGEDGILPSLGFKNCEIKEYEL